MCHQVDEVVAAYLEDRESGKATPLEQFLDRGNPAERSTLFRMLLEQELTHLASGGVVTDPAEYLRRFPGLQEVVHEVFRTSPTIVPNSLSTPADHRLESTVIHSQIDTATSDAASVDPDITQIGRFRIVRELGRGAFGRVFLAYDAGLDRMLAIKVLRSERGLSAEIRDRFLREGRAAARLRHPNIAAVFEATSGEAKIGSATQQVSYIATEYIEGPTLRQAIRRGEEWAPVECARLIEAVASAVGYAHRQGVTHRDIKPGNILLSVGGQPQLVDFGLAGMDDSGEELTGRHEIFGTPAYISPELVHEGATASGPASDVWAIGVILYELLTGIRPFENANLQELTRDISAKQIPAPRTLKSDVPSDLSAICMKALSRNVEDRYRDGMALEEDLHSFLHGLPVSALPLPPLARLVRWAKRRPALATMTFLVFLVTVAGASVSSILAYNANASAAESKRNAQAADREAKKALARSEEALRESVRAERNLYRARVLLAQNYWHRGDAPRVRDELQNYAETDDNSPVVPGWEWNFLWRLVNKESVVSVGHRRGINDIQLSPDGKIIASAGSGGMLRLWDPKDGTVKAVIDEAKGLNDLRFHPAGQFVAAADWDGRVLICSTVGEAQTRILECHDDSIKRLEFAEGGKRIVTSGGDQKVRLWDFETGEMVSEAGGEQFGDWHHEIAVSPDGKTIAFEGAGKITLLNASSGEEISSVSAGRKARTAVLRFSPDGKWLFSSGVGDPVFYRAENLQAAPVNLPGDNRVDDLVWAADSKTFAAEEAGIGQLPLQVAIWQMSEDGVPERLSRLDVTGREVESMTFLPDNSLVTGQDNGLIQVWDVTQGTRTEFFPGHKGEVTCLAFTPDGMTIFSGGHHDQALRAWQKGTGRESVSHRICSVRAMSTVFDTAREQLLAVGWGMQQGIVDILALPDLADQGEVGDAQRSGSSVYDIDLSPDNETVALCLGKEVRLINRASGEFVAVECPASVECLVFHPKRPLLFAGMRDGNVQVIDTQKGDRMRVVRCHSRSILDIAIHPDGSQFATASFDGSVNVIETLNYQSLITLDWDGWYVFSVAYSPDGTRLAAGSHIPVVKLWTTDNFAEVATLKGHASRVNSISFHPDGSRLATCGWDGTTRIWQAESWQELCVIEPQAGTLFDCNFSPDGGYLAVACEDGTIRLFDGRPPE